MKQLSFCIVKMLAKVQKSNFLYLWLGKCLRDVPKHWLHTPAVSKCLRDAPTRCSHTPAVGKCLRVAPKRCSHTPAVGKCLGDTPTRCSHTPAVSKCPKDAPKRCSHTPAVGKCLRHDPQHSLGYLQKLCGAFDDLFGPYIILKSPKKAKTPIFSSSVLNNSAPWWRIKKPAVSVSPDCQKDHFCQVSYKSVNVKGNFQE